MSDIKGRRIRIAIIISSLETGGAEAMLFRLLSHIDQYVYEPRVYSLSSLGRFGKEIEELGILVESLRLDQHFLSSCVSMVRKLNKFHPDIVHTWLYHSDLIGGIAGKLVRARGIIWTIRSADFIQSDTKWSTRLVVKMCAALSRVIPDVVIYNSNKGLSTHKTYGYKEKRRLIIYNGIDKEVFAPQRDAKEHLCQSLALPSYSQLVGMVGRYDPLKNHIGFLEVAAKIRERIPEVRFICAGQGVDSSNVALIDKMKELDIIGHVELLGLRTDIPQLLPAFDLTCLTSTSEAFPNVVLESLACGVPCVATDVGDVRSIIEDEDWVVPVGDMGSMAEKCIQYLQMPTWERLAHKSKIRKQVVSNFDIRETAVKFEDVYKSLGNYEEETV